MEGPQLVTTSTFTAGGTNSLTVSSQYSQCMVVFCMGNGGSNPNTAPSVTYNGTAVTWAPGNENTIYFTNSPWIGYIINPSVGTFNLVSPSSLGVTAQLWRNVDLANPFPFLTGSNSAGTANSSPVGLSLTTQYDHSVLLKSFWGNTAPDFMFYSDGTGETGDGLTAHGSAPFENPYNKANFRWSYKGTTTTASYSMTTSYIDNFGHTGSTQYACQVVELKYSGPQTQASSVSTANGASRFAAIARGVTNYRSTSASVSNAASRFATGGKFFAQMVSTTVANAAGRTATVAYVLHSAWHSIAKSVASWVGPTRSSASWTIPNKDSSTWTPLNKDNAAWTPLPKGGIAEIMWNAILTTWATETRTWNNLFIQNATIWNSLTRS